MFKGLSLLAASEIKGVITRNVRAAVYFAVGAVVLLFALSFLLDLAHGWLAYRMGPGVASGVIAAVLLTVAGALFLIGNMIKDRPAPERSTLKTSAIVAAPFAARMLSGKLRLGTVAIAGVVAVGALLGRYLGRSSS
jgi:uncharacterized membrane protein YcfT